MSSKVVLSNWIAVLLLDAAACLCSMTKCSEQNSILLIPLPNLTPSISKLPSYPLPVILVLKPISRRTEPLKARCSTGEKS
jgi:hypothetical protein